MNFLPKLTGSFAMPASENPTVEMVEAAYRHHEMHMRYINVEVGPDKLAKAIEGAVAMGWVGFNCSIPNKVEVIQYIDRLAKSAEIIGAVNCVVIQDRELIGENTDGKGFIKSLKTIVNPFGKNAVVFGAGGAARAICVELAFSGVKTITVVNRSKKRGIDLVALINKKTDTKAQFKEWEDQITIDPKTDLVINATSIGLFPDVESDLPLDYNSLTQAMIVADVIPNPPHTRFLKNCASIGCSTIDGLGMLVNQGVAGIELWTGIKVDESVMRSRLEEITINSTNWQKLDLQGPVQVLSAFSEGVKTQYCEKAKSKWGQRGVPQRDSFEMRSVLSATIHPDIKRTLMAISKRTGMTVSQVVDEPPK